MISITPLYAGIIALLFAFLSTRVILWRRKARISVGDGADKEMLKRMRVQANCAEYAPFALLLLAMTELLGAPGWVVHLLGLLLLAGRFLHAYGLGSNPQVIQARQGGMMLTFLMIILAALANIGHVLF